MSVVVRHHGSLLAIDPGTTRSAWAHFISGVLTGFACEPNERMLLRVASHRSPLAEAVCEQVESYGMPVGREVFETVRWSGRFEQMFIGSHVSVSLQWHWLPRRAVKLELCNSPRANDASIRQSIVDLYGGKAKAIGKKAAPGPLYGVSGDVWAAVAVGLTHMRQRAQARGEAA